MLKLTPHSPEPFAESIMAALFGFSRLFGAAANNCVKIVGTPLIANQRFKRYLPRGPIPGTVPIFHQPSWIPKTLPEQVEIQAPSIKDDKLTDGVIKSINELVTTGNTSRLFAVVHICGKQFKVTENDVIIIQGYWPPNPGDQLKLEKVLLVGSTDFSLVGRPILNRELVTVDATVIEKTFSQTKTRFRMRPRKQYKRFHFYRIQHTMVRINSISINGKIDEKKEVEGLDRIY